MGVSNLELSGTYTEATDEEIQSLYYKYLEAWKDWVTADAEYVVAAARNNRQTSDENRAQVEAAKAKLEAAIDELNKAYQAYLDALNQ